MYKILIPPFLVLIILILTLISLTSVNLGEPKRDDWATNIPSGGIHRTGGSSGSDSYQGNDPDFYILFKTGILIPIENKSSGFTEFPVFWDISQWSKNYNCFLQFCQSKKPDRFSMSFYVYSKNFNTNKISSIWGITEIYPNKWTHSNQIISFQTFTATMSEYIGKQGNINTVRFVPGENSSIDDYSETREMLEFNEKNWVQIGFIDNDFGSGELSSDYKNQVNLNGLFILGTSNEWYSELKEIPYYERSLKIMIHLDLVWKGFGIGFPGHQETIITVLGDNVANRGADINLRWNQTL